MRKGFASHFNGLPINRKIEVANRIIWGLDLDLALLRGSWSEVPEWIVKSRDEWIARRDEMVWENKDVHIIA